MLAGAPPRVMLVLGSLSGGGAERVAVNLVNRCDPSAVDMRLGLLARTGQLLGEVDPRRVTAPPLVRRGLVGGLGTPGDIARMIRQVRPQVLMSFGMGVNMLTYLALRLIWRGRPRWICRDDCNSVAEIANLRTNAVGRATVRAGMRIVYPSADGLVGVSTDMARVLERQLALTPGRVRVIHNPIDIGGIALLAAEPLAVAPKRPFMVTAGRLTHQKGQDLLIDAFAASTAAREMDLVILGQGPLESVLRERAKNLGVGDRVKFAGFQVNPWAWFSKARLFVMPSRWEGFGNVVAEALACGVPTLVTDCDFGPREQVVHGQSGWIVPANDAAALTHGLDTVLGNQMLARRLALGGTARAGDFDLGAIAGVYTGLFLAQATGRQGSIAPQHGLADCPFSEEHVARVLVPNETLPLHD